MYSSYNIDILKTKINNLNGIFWGVPHNLIALVYISRLAVAPYGIITIKSTFLSGHGFMLEKVVDENLLGSRITAPMEFLEPIIDHIYGLISVFIITVKC